jgi:hypothetical protein
MLEKYNKIKSILPECGFDNEVTEVMLTSPEKRKLLSSIKEIVFPDCLTRHKKKHMKIKQAEFLYK